MPEQFPAPSKLLELRVQKHAADHGVSYAQAFADYTRLGEGAELLQKARAFEKRRDPDAEAAARVEMRKASAADAAEKERLARATYEEIQTGRDGALAAATSKLNALAAEYAAANNVSQTVAYGRVSMQGEGLRLYQEIRQLEMANSLKRSTAVASGPARAIRS